MWAMNGDARRGETVSISIATETVVPRRRAHRPDYDRFSPYGNPATEKRVVQPSPAAAASDRVAVDGAHWRLVGIGPERARRR
jgi:hypothetical protein